MMAKYILTVFLARVASQVLEPEPQSEQVTILREDITGTVLSDVAARVLNASTSPSCPLNCTVYHAGASANSPFVAQVLPSGIGDLGSNLTVSCYPHYGVGAPFTEDWLVCYQSVDDRTSIPAPKTAISICEELIDEIGSIDVDSLGNTGVLGVRSTSETTNGRWMKGKGDIGCGWGAGLNSGSGLGGPNVNTEAWTLNEWVANVGYRVKRWSTSVSDEKECCMYAMSFEGSRWQEGGSAVRFQFGSGTCHVDRETMIRANLDRSSGLAMRDTETCGTGVLYWRHVTGGADAANLKGETRCQKNNGFSVLSSIDSSAYFPIGSLPDHFTSQWGNELPNHNCANWPYGDCKGVIGYNIIASPEACCEACVNLKWIGSVHGDVSMKAGVDGQIYSNPCVAWQVVGGKCRILREEMVRNYPSFQGKSVRQAIESGTSCLPQTQGSSIWNSERNCNYYSFARYRETFNVTPPVNRTTPGFDNATNATFSKIVVFDFESAMGAAAEVLDEATQFSTTQILEVKASVLSLIGTGSSSRAATILDNDLSAWVERQKLQMDNSTCARIKLFSSADMTIFQDGSTSLQDPSTAPWCETMVCLSSGAELSLECNMTTFLLRLAEDQIVGRRLGTTDSVDVRRLTVVPKIVFSFDGDGTGKDNIVFNDVSVARKIVTKSTITIDVSTKAATSTTVDDASTKATTSTTVDDATTTLDDITSSVGDNTTNGTSSEMNTTTDKFVENSLASMITPASMITLCICSLLRS